MKKERERCKSTSSKRETPMMWNTLKYNIAFFMEKRLDGKD